LFLHRMFCVASCLSLVACVELGEGEDDLAADSLATEEQAIIGGIATTARPEIGELSRWSVRNDGVRRNGMCTATLIAPSYAITAAHCLNRDNWQDTTVDPADLFSMWTAAGRIDRRPVRYYSFGSHLTEKIWNGLGSDVALVKLDAPVPATVPPAPIAETRVTSSTEWSTRFGYGCTNRDTQAGAGTKRYRSFQGLVSNFLCFGDSGGPTLKGAGVNASPIWAINSGFSWDLSTGIDGYFDIVGDATYHKKQIEAVIQSWDGEYEVGIDRLGADYRTVATTSPSTCRNTCAGDARCRAWTLYGSTCYLKDAVPGWTPLAGATSGLSPNRDWSPEAEYDRPGADYHSFLYSGLQTQCMDACAKDYRCQAYTVGPYVNGQRRCWLKNAMPNPVRKAGHAAGARRGLDMNSRRSGVVLLHHFSYSMPSPELCQAECAKRGTCRSWTYQGPANGRSPQCWLYSNEGARASFTGFVSGVKGREFR
jgi:hypothetical protein